MRRLLSVVQTTALLRKHEDRPHSPQLSVEDVEAKEVVEVMNLHRALSDSLTTA
jgi:hypothetical protein